MAEGFGEEVYRSVRPEFKRGRMTGEKVKVVARMRPFTENEKICPLKQVICYGNKIRVKEHDHQPSKYSGRSTDGLEFNFDYVQDDSFVPVHDRHRKEESQKRMYKALGAPCVEFALKGINTTILAYGQTGSGKTYTMAGDGTSAGRGIMPMLTCELIHRLQTQLQTEFCLLQVSYLEIYQEKVRDLLAQPAASGTDSLRDNTHPHEDPLESDADSELDATTRETGTSVHGEGLKIGSSATSLSTSTTIMPTTRQGFLRVREHPVTGPYVEGLLWKEVRTWNEMEELLRQGARNRTIDKDTHSLRSHSLFTIKLTRGNLSSTAEHTVSHINLVDLAGCDRLKRGDEKGAPDQDWKYVNRSLSQLNEVIMNVSKSNYTSYRGCALTWLLRESLGKNSRTYLLATVSPAGQDFQESLNTLRYFTKANRVDTVYPTSLESDPRKKLICKMKEEIDTLQHLITYLTQAACTTSSARVPVSKTSHSTQVTKAEPSKASHHFSNFCNSSAQCPAPTGGN